MSVNKNPLWNYGSIISPDKLNEIELALNKIESGCISKQVIFNSDGSVTEYFGENEGTDLKNTKITKFNTNDEIVEEYTFYFKTGDLTNDYKEFKFNKIIIFDSEGNITEEIEVSE